MALAIAQFAEGAGSGFSTPGAVTITSTPTVGNLLLAFLSVNGGSGITIGSGWTLFETAGSSVNGMLGLYRYVQSGDTATLPAFCSAGSADWSWIVYEVSGVSGTFSSDVEGHTNAYDSSNTQTLTVGPYTTTQPNTLAVVAGAMEGDSANSPELSSGWGPGIGGGIYPAVALQVVGDSVQLNAGASTFNMTAPSGFSAWDSSGSCTFSPVGAAIEVTDSGLQANGNQMFPAWSGIGTGSGGNEVCTLNTGASTFDMTAPSGFSAWDSSGSCIWNSSNEGANISLSNGNLTATHTNAASWTTVTATTGHGQGKYYFEYFVNTLTDAQMYGLLNSYGPVNTYLGNSQANGVDCGAGYISSSFGGNCYGLISGNTWQGGVVTGQYVGVAVDLTNNLIWTRRSGSTNWNNSGTANPATGTGGFKFTNSAQGGSPGVAKGSTVRTTGKYYFEVYSVADPAQQAAFEQGFGITNNQSGASPQNGYGLFYVPNGQVFVNNAGGYGSWQNIESDLPGSYVGIAVDIDNRLIWARDSSSTNWNGSGTANPATGTGGIIIPATIFIPNVDQSSDGDSFGWCSGHQAFAASGSSVSATVNFQGVSNPSAAILVVLQSEVPMAPVTIIIMG